MYKLVMRGEGGQKEEFRKRMEVDSCSNYIYSRLQTLLFNVLKAFEESEERVRIII